MLEILFMILLKHV